MDGAAVAQQTRMRQLADQPHTEVLEYCYSTPHRDADAVTCVKMARRSVELRKALPLDLNVCVAARKVCKDELAQQFSRSHPETFMAMMDPEHSGRALEMLERLARLRMDVETRNMSEAEANVHANRIIMEKTMREPSQDEKEKLVL